jgi:hypothetical protein
LVANGEQVTCAGVIRDAPLLIDGAAFPADLYSTSCRWPGVTSSSASGGSALWAPSFGTLAAGACLSSTKDNMSLGLASTALRYLLWAPPQATTTDSLLEALLLTFGGLFADP